MTSHLHRMLAFASVMIIFWPDISGGAFKDCTSLKKLDLPSTLKEVGQDAFVNTAIATLTIPGSLKKIESYAFADMPELHEIHIEERQCQTNTNKKSCTYVTLTKVSRKSKTLHSARREEDRGLKGRQTATG